MISQQVLLLMQQQCISETDLDIDELFKLALTAEKILPKKASLTQAGAVQTSNSTTRNSRYFYSDKLGHSINECLQKKKNKKPCQKYIDLGIEATTYRHKIYR